MRRFWKRLVWGHYGVNTSIMNSTSRVIAAVAVLILIGLFAWWTMNGSQPSAPGSDTATTTATSTAPADTTTQAPAKSSTSTSGNTLKSVLTQKGSYECDYDQVQSTGQSHNVVYLSDGKMRAEFRTTSGNTTTANLSVYDGRYLYSWKEGMSTGTRTTVTKLSDLPSAIPQDLTSGTIYGTSYESVGWKCHAWIADAKLLAAPNYVTFR